LPANAVRHRQLHHARGHDLGLVYDRDRKGAALIGNALAVNLTIEQAEQVKRGLTTPAQDNEAFRAELSKWRIV
jgi:hypothetical protein